MTATVSDLETLQFGPSELALADSPIVPNGLSFGWMDVDMDSGRETTSGEMVRNFIAEKRKITVSFPPTRDTDALSQLLNMLRTSKSRQFFYVRAFDIVANQVVTMRAYCGDRVVPAYNWALHMYDSFSVEIVEK